MLRAVLNRKADVFSKQKADIGCCNFVEHEIEQGEGAVPHREEARRMTPHKSEAFRAEIEMLLKYDMIEPSKSPWACGVLIAKKKGGQLSFCMRPLLPERGNYKRRLTNSTHRRKPLETWKLGDAKWFTTVDLDSAYWQVPFRKQDRERTGSACELGLYQWKRICPLSCAMRRRPFKE